LISSHYENNIGRPGFRFERSPCLRPGPAGTPVENFPDTDHDGYQDFVEVAASTNPNDPADSPATHGFLTFIVDRDRTAIPAVPDCTITSTIESLDVFFLMDTTGSMPTMLTLFQARLSSIFTSLKTLNPDIAIGVGSYRDFPTSGYGSSGDWPFALSHRIMTVRTAAGSASIQSAINALSAGGGGDGPEASWEALHEVATGAGITQGGAAVPAWNPATAYPLTPVAGESFGTLPGVGFRDGSCRIICWVTDASGHNTDTPGVTQSDYSFGGVRSTAVLSELSAMGVHVIGLCPSYTGDARKDQLAAIIYTNTRSTPNSGPGHPFYGITGCALGQCATGINGAGEASDPVGPLCNLSFVIDSTTWSGIETAVPLGVKALTQAWYYNLSASVMDDPADGVDARAFFLDKVEALTAGSGTPVDTNGDGTLGTYASAKIGGTMSLKVHAKTNTAISRAAAPQCFRAELRATADGQFVLGRRTSLFIVPPVN
jgi:hypothetical protein